MNCERKNLKVTTAEGDKKHVHVHLYTGTNLCVCQMLKLISQKQKDKTDNLCYLMCHYKNLT